ncbi:MAG TPA: methyltransferase domain-containing protein [Aggregatilinea sp.]|uniref:class I SAM-dependent methyltransferase n=1 Tax=Aggregatilinea sp. TaxID=2806333 RepID=UPI002D103906|nr:methyltransferase domain-containing protein [Aggregatilinea sp.]HML24850.1 methyltransferase domain-containing protein [Aggregatilinea sp.]
MSQNANAETAQQYKALEARFDRAAKLYDATYGQPDEQGHGNLLLGWLRDRHLAVLRDVMPERALLLEIGSGTGEEALILAREGYSVLGIDISPVMVRQAQTKAAVHGLSRSATFRTLPAGRLAALDERGPFQGAYASLGTLNTEPDLAGMARGLHALLVPGAPFVATMMSRHCLYEILHYLVRFKPGRIMRRGPDWHEARAGTGGVDAPVKFYSPRAFAAAIAPYFTVESVQALPLWLPPVHMHDLYRERQAHFAQREGWDRRMRTWPAFRAWGDHFIMVLRQNPDAAAPEQDAAAPPDTSTEEPS